MKYPLSISELIEKIEWSALAEESVFRGDECIRRGDYVSARALYSEAIEIQNDNFDAFAGLEYLDFLEGTAGKTFEGSKNPVDQNLIALRSSNSILNKEEFEARKRKLTS